MVYRHGYGMSTSIYSSAIFIYFYYNYLLTKKLKYHWYIDIVMLYGYEMIICKYY